MKFETKAIHSGQDPEPTTGAVVVPIFATSTYAQGCSRQTCRIRLLPTDNPTRSALQTALAALEGVDEGWGRLHRYRVRHGGNRAAGLHAQGGRSCPASRRCLRRHLPLFREGAR